MVTINASSLASYSYHEALTWLFQCLVLCYTFAPVLNNSLSAALERIIFYAKNLWVLFLP